MPKQYERGFEYLAQGDYKNAFKSFERSAEKGHVESQFQLGLLYEYGKGVKTAYNNSAQWYKLAAAYDHVVAVYRLGFLYESGLGVSQDYVKAKGYYTRAFEMGYLDAYALSLIHISEPTRPY